MVELATITLCSNSRHCGLAPVIGQKATMIKFKQTFLILSILVALQTPSYAQVCYQCRTLKDSYKFANRVFTREIFWQIPGWAKFCESHGIGQTCSASRKYHFKNARLTVFSQSTEQFGRIFEFKNPVSIPNAIETGKILSEGGISFKKQAKRDGRQIVYEGEFMEGIGSLANCTLHLNKTNQVYKLSCFRGTP